MKYHAYHDIMHEYHEYIWNIMHETHCLAMIRRPSLQLEHAPMLRLRASSFGAAGSPREQGGDDTSIVGHSWTDTISMRIQRIT